MKRMGYKRTEDGKWEEPTRYIERQSGILATFIAQTTNRLPASPASPSSHPYPLLHAWKWAARILRHTCRSEIEAGMMATFLEVVNQAFLKEYGKQGRKVVSLAVGEWRGEVRGPNAGRLEIMGEEFMRMGRIGEAGYGEFVP